MGSAGDERTSAASVDASTPSSSTRREEKTDGNDASGASRVPNMAGERFRDRGTGLAAGDGATTEGRPVAFGADDVPDTLGCPRHPRTRPTWTRRRSGAPPTRTRRRSRCRSSRAAKAAPLKRRRRVREICAPRAARQHAPRRRSGLSARLPRRALPGGSRGRGGTSTRPAAHARLALGARARHRGRCFFSCQGTLENSSPARPSRLL